MRSPQRRLLTYLPHRFLARRLLAHRPVRAASDEDYVSEDDEKVENSTFIGLRAIEKIIGGTVIDERPLHQP